MNVGINGRDWRVKKGSRERVLFSLSKGRYTFHVLIVESYLYYALGYVNRARLFCCKALNVVNGVLVTNDQLCNICLFQLSRCLWNVLSPSRGLPFLQEVMNVNTFSALILNLTCNSTVNEGPGGVRCASECFVLIFVCSERKVFV